MERSESIVNLTKAMLVAQKNIGGAVKGAKNPFFRSNYADLPSVMEACKDALNDAGILVSQMLNSEVDGDFLITLLIHGETGEFIGSKMKIYNHKDIQGTMSEQTYLRRYMLQALAFIPAVDDDGEGAMGRKNEPPARVGKEAKPEVKPEAPKAAEKTEPRRFVRPAKAEAAKPEVKVEEKKEDTKVETPKTEAKAGW